MDTHQTVQSFEKKHCRARRRRPPIWLLSRPTQAMETLNFHRTKRFEVGSIEQFRLYRKCQFLAEAKSLLIRADMLLSTAGGGAAGWGQGVCCGGADLRP
ncbi:hypothetical protein LY76DRAFT_404177 [Colletotrichum caudatum]|nr:hypothetical protein LY76DRAFT_404177 [Colletotrichum caudatum]